MDNLNLFIPITKVDLERREVWGYLTLEEPDNANEILDYASSKPLFENWSNQAQKRSNGKSKGNLRAMHGPIAAGKLISMQADDQRKGIYIGAHVVDDGEWAKCSEGVYTGFSVGGSYVRRWPDVKPGLVRYTAQPSEASLVDAPCVSNAVFDVVKQDGIEQRLFKADGTGEHKLVLGETPLQSATIQGSGVTSAQTFNLSYDGTTINVNLAKSNDALTPPNSIQPAIITTQVVSQQVEEVQMKPYTLDLPDDAGQTPNGDTLAAASNPTVNLETVAAPIAPKAQSVDNKIHTINKTVKVTHRTVKVIR